MSFSVTASCLVGAGVGHRENAHSTSCHSIQREVFDRGHSIFHCFSSYVSKTAGSELEQKQSNWDLNQSALCEDNSTAGSSLMCCHSAHATAQIFINLSYHPQWSVEKVECLLSTCYVQGIRLGIDGAFII